MKTPDQLLQSLTAERDALAPMTHRLSAFINTEEFHTLDETHKLLLLNQRNAMCAFLGCLNARIELTKNNLKSTEK